MTLIVAHKNNGRVIMAGDGYSCAGSDVYASATPKVFSCTRDYLGQQTTFLFGHAGAIRGLSLLKKAVFGMESFFNGADDISEEIFKVFKAHDYLSFDKGRSESENDILIAYAGEIFHLDKGFGLFQTADDYFCVGSGQDYAFGAMRTMKNLEEYKVSINPKHQIRHAFSATSYYMKSIGGEITFVEA